MATATPVTTTRTIGVTLELSTVEAKTLLSKLMSETARPTQHYAKIRLDRIRKALLDAGVPLPFTPVGSKPPLCTSAPRRPGPGARHVRRAQIRPTVWPC